LEIRASEIQRRRGKSHESLCLCVAAARGLGNGETGWRQGLLHDQRGVAEVQHPPADTSLVRTGRAAQAIADEGNTRLYSEEDLEQLETILTLTRDLGVNLAGVEIILNMRRKIEQMQGEVNEFMDYVKRELARGIDDWEQRLGTALVKSSPTDLVRRTPPPQADAQTDRSKAKK
jgi:MerR family transcriptional regulator/heat shock protein HspR